MHDIYYIITVQVLW